MGFRAGFRLGAWFRLFVLRAHKVCFFSEYFPVKVARGQVGGDRVILMVVRISICPGCDNIRVIVPVICFHFPHNITILPCSLLFAMVWTQSSSLYYPRCDNNTTDATTHSQEEEDNFFRVSKNFPLPLLKYCRQTRGIF